MSPAWWMSSRPTALRRWRLAPLVLLLAAPGCVYYNGIYNAQSAAKDADARVRQHNESDAQSFFQRSAAAAESVLVRHPKSKWRTRALYLAGRSGAYGGQCDHAVTRLQEFLSRADAPAGDRDRARIALAACDLQTANVTAARARLDSLLSLPDAQSAREARVWAARAALAAGDRDAVTRLLGDADDELLSWELVMSSLAAQEYARVESLLVARAARGDYREDVPRAIRELWAAGRWDGVESIVRGYDATRVRDVSRATMHLTVGDLNLRAERDTIARQHLRAAKLLAGRDTVVEREAAARLALEPIARVNSLRELDSLLALPDSASRRSTYAQRVGEQLLLFKLFARQTEPTGASLFLAAEVARDSLRARPLARSLFLTIVREMPTSPLAPQALYSASVLQSDSATVWRDRVQRDYPNSAVATWLRGDDPATRPDFTSNPPLLLLRWNETLRIWSDSVRRLRATPRSPVPATIRP